MMKRRNMQRARILMTCLMVTLIGVSCTKNFDDVNTPKDVLVMDPTLMGQAFAQSQYSAMCGQYQQTQNLFADIYAQYFATTQPNFDCDQFVEVGNWTNTGFNYFYGSSAPQLLQVVRYTEEQGLIVENAVAKVWKVQMYHRVSDYFGPIMYSEFGNGETSVPYDDQETVYKSFFQTLDEAVAVLEQHTDEAVFGAHDQIYAGDVQQWLTFANSLRLRLAMRLSYVEPELARSEAEKAVAGGVMMGNADNAAVLSTINSINGLATWTYINE